MEKFYQAGCELRSTIFENNRKDSFRSASLPKIKSREGMKNIITKNLNSQSWVEKEEQDQNQPELSFRQRFEQRVQP